MHAADTEKIIRIGFQQLLFICYVNVLCEGSAGGGAMLQASAGAAELAAAQARSVGQLQALESQLASKDAALDASQVRLAALEVELKGAQSKVRARCPVSGKKNGSTIMLGHLFL